MASAHNVSSDHVNHTDAASISSLLVWHFCSAYYYIPLFKQYNNIILMHNKTILLLQFLYFGSCVLQLLHHCRFSFFSDVEATNISNIETAGTLNSMVLAFQVLIRLSIVLLKVCDSHSAHNVITIKKGSPIFNQTVWSFFKMHGSSVWYLMLPTLNLDSL